MGPKKMPEGREKPKRAAKEGQQRRDWMTPEQRAEYEREIRRLRREGKLPSAPRGSDISETLSKFSTQNPPTPPRPNMPTKAEMGRIAEFLGSNRLIMPGDVKTPRVHNRDYEIPGSPLKPGGAKPKKRK